MVANGTVVVYKSPYTGHLTKAEIIGPTEWFQNDKSIGFRGISFRELTDAGTPEGTIYTAWSESGIVKEVARDFKLKCPHCE